MNEGPDLTKEVGRAVESAQPVVTQESDAIQQLEATRQIEMTLLMEQLEKQRETKGNFAVTVGYEGDADSRNIVFIAPVKTHHYSENRQGFIPDPANRGEILRPLEATTFTLASKDGFTTVVLETEDMASSLTIRENQTAKHMAHVLGAVLRAAAEKDGHITLPQPTGKDKPMPVYELMKQALQMNPEETLSLGGHLRFHDANRDPNLVTQTVKKSLEAAQQPHMKRMAEAKQTTANLKQTATAVRTSLA